VKEDILVAIKYQSKWTIQNRLSITDSLKNN